jgi:hypothetical protein
MIRRRLVLGVVAWAAASLVALGLGGVPAAAGTEVHTVPGMDSLWGVECRPDGTCLGVGSRPVGAATVVLGATGAVGPVRPVPATDRLNDVTCLPAGSCLAVGSGRRSAVVVRLGADGTPTAVRPVVGATMLSGVACPTATTCLATGERVTTLSSYPYNIIVPVYVVITNGEPGLGLRYPRGIRSMRGIDCPSATRCLAVGDGDVSVFTAAGGSWSVTSHTVPGSAYPAEDISCPSPAVCHATAHEERQVSGGFVAVPAVMSVTADGVAGPAQALTDRSGTVHGISCVAEGTCTVVGHDNIASRPMVVDVRPGQPPAVTLVDTSANFYDVSCISATACGIVGSGGGPPRAVFAWRS